VGFVRFTQCFVSSKSEQKFRSAKIRTLKEKKREEFPSISALNVALENAQGNALSKVDPIARTSKNYYSEHFQQHIMLIL